jgi:catalase
MLQLVDESLALRVAEGLGMTQIPKLEHPLNHSVPADGDPARFQPVLKGPVETTSPALSMANTVKDTVLTRKVAILASDGADTASIRTMQDALLAAGAQGKVVATHLGVLKGAEGDELPIDFSLLTTSSVLFDAVYVPGGAKSAARLALERDALEFVTDAYRHCKPMAATAEGAELLKSAGISGPEDEGILTSPESLSAGIVQRFLESIARHRFWSRGSRNRIGPPTSDGTRGGAIRTPGA